MREDMREDMREESWKGTVEERQNLCWRLSTRESLDSSGIVVALIRNRVVVTIIVVVVVVVTEQSVDEAG